MLIPWRVTHGDVLTHASAHLHEDLFLFLLPLHTFSQHQKQSCRFLKVDFLGVCWGVAKTMVYSG